MLSKLLILSEHGTAFYPYLRENHFAFCIHFEPMERLQTEQIFEETYCQLLKYKPLKENILLASIYVILGADPGAKMQELERHQTWRIKRDQKCTGLGAVEIDSYGSWSS